MGTVQADFDRIALLSPEGWDHNTQYHGYLLRQLPAHCETALDVGCGTGSFSRLLAGRAGRVVALDLSPRMIEVAKERSRQYPNIQFIESSRRRHSLRCVLGEGQTSFSACPVALGHLFPVGYTSSSETTVA